MVVLAGSWSRVAARLLRESLEPHVHRGACQRVADTEDRVPHPPDCCSQGSPAVAWAPRETAMPGYAQSALASAIRVRFVWCPPL